MINLKDLNNAYERVKDNKLENIILYILMPTGETEIIVNPKVDEKMDYINKTYDENLVHKNCKAIKITDVVFCEEVKEFTFGDAIDLVKEGKKIARKGWNGKGMFVYYIPENSYPTVTEIAKDEFGEKVNYNPYLAIKNVNGRVSTWVPSINDCLAEDWQVVE